jgi:hypothetical protein
MIQITGSDRHELLEAMTVTNVRSSGKHVRDVKIPYYRQFLCAPATEEGETLFIRSYFEENDRICLMTKAMKHNFDVQIIIA